MAVAAADVVRADVRMNFSSNQRIQNTFHLRNDGASQAEADVVDDMVEILEALYVILAAILNIVLVVQDIRIINVSAGTDVGTGLFVDTTPGTVTTVSVPQNSVSLNLSTARLNVVGRKFFGPIGSAQFSQNGIIGAGTLTALGNAGDDMIALQVATNSNWRFGVIASFDSVFLPFQSFSVTPTITTQRRRRIGVGI